MTLKLEKKELIFAIVGIAFLFSWFLFIKDDLTPILESINPIFATILFHLGVYIAIFLLAYLLLPKKYKVKISFIALSILVGLDIADAPYIIDKSGIINKSIDFWFTTYDAAFATIYSNFVSGYVLYFLVYIITPIFLIFILPIIIARPKKIVEALQK